MKKINNKISMALTALVLLVTTAASAQLTVSKVNSRNRVAVMPMAYIGDGNEERTEEMRFFLQDIAISYMSRSAAELKFMDVAEINAVLFKNGINEETIRQYTPRELADILNVEYIIMGSVLQDKGNVVTVSNHHSSRRQNLEHRHGYGRHGRYINNRSNSSRSSVTRQKIKTQVSLSIYNDTGERIYATSRQSILSESDAYKNAIQYLLKRTPLYKR